jgi:hypothetical protein
VTIKRCIRIDFNEQVLRRALASYGLRRPHRATLHKDSPRLEMAERIVNIVDYDNGNAPLLLVEGE